MACKFSVLRSILWKDLLDAKGVWYQSLYRGTNLPEAILDIMLCTVLGFQRQCVLESSLDSIYMISPSVQLEL